MALQNAYTIAPNEIKPGDEFLFTIKAMVTHDGKFKLYRCPWESDQIPQGSQIYLNVERVAEAVFPCLLFAELEPGV